MNHERRYGDEEIAAIFEDAAKPGFRPGKGLSSPSHGLTLEDLQSIGREVGISPERIADAARALDQRPQSPERRSDLGIPVGVSRTASLPRLPTDREWSILLGELRDTYAAHGNDVSQGEIRGWTNGNLHAFIEPTENGYRLRQGTVKGDGVAVNRMGAGFWMAAVAFLVVLYLTGQLAEDFMIPVVFSLIGTGALAYNALRLPPWARRREEQMAHIEGRAKELIAESPATEQSGA